MKKNVLMETKFRLEELRIAVSGSGSKVLFSNIFNRFVLREAKLRLGKLRIADSSLRSKASFGNKMNTDVSKK